jgi:L-ascorbate metabolism protein UlaG (beta-lactamase superfamily)
MRLKPGRPDLGAYRDRFTVPAAAGDAPLSITWLGVATLLIDDGTSRVLTDGFFSRPSLPAVALRKLAPSTARVDGCLTRAGITELAAVIPVHTHYDHALDTALVAERTGARVIGGESAAFIARGYGLADDRIVVATSGVPMSVGAFDVTLIESHHCPPDRFPSVITEPVVTPAKLSAYKCGEAWSVLIAHWPTGRRMLVQGSAGYVPGALEGQQAEVSYLGLGQLGLQPRDYLEQYWTETVRAVGATTVIGIHWDDFFRPLSQPLRALPFASDDLDVTMRVLGELAEQDGVALRLPTVWRREDPWA